MLTPSHKPTLSNLPLDIKFLLLADLASVRDLRSLINTCTAFRTIRTLDLWEIIEQQVFERETGERFSAELVSLSRLRRIKKDGEFDGFEEMDNVELKEVFRDCMNIRIPEISPTRRIIEWYIETFYEEYKTMRTRPPGQNKAPKTPNEQEDEKEKEEPQNQPTDNTEPKTRKIVEEMEDAICALWLLVEASSDIEYTRDCWVRSSIYLWRFHCFSMRKHRNCRLGGFDTFKKILSMKLWEIAGICAKRLQKRYERGLVYPKEDDKTLFLFWMDRFAKVGIPKMLMTQLGLDGVKRLLELPFEAQMSEMEFYFESTLIKYDIGWMFGGGGDDYKIKSEDGDEDEKEDESEGEEEEEEEGNDHSGIEIVELEPEDFRRELLNHFYRWATCCDINCLFRNMYDPVW
ncbi:hypothetical protein TWF718_007833 [Orbilia javanica]|uniref:F-box domain-containing protein n=1 Tax=Orbilia javanica TaxID=47235 RepID=A0AAN8RGS4_9PEZI